MNEKVFFGMKQNNWNEIALFEMKLKYFELK